MALAWAEDAQTDSSLGSKTISGGLGDGGFCVKSTGLVYLGTQLPALTLLESMFDFDRKCHIP